MEHRRLHQLVPGRERLATPTVWLGTTAEFRRATRRVDLAEYEVLRPAVAEAAPSAAADAAQAADAEAAPGADATAEVGA